jgi:GMP synthase (glutamine-hydrolysing)
MSEAIPMTHLYRAIGTEPEKKPVLLIMHRFESEPGAVGQYLKANGIPLDIRRPRFGDQLPASMSGHAGAIIFGGPMSANDPDDYIKKEIDWIGVPLAEGKPLFGICLGAQMLAKHLGGEVYTHRSGRIEAGYEPIAPHDEALTLGPWPSHVYHWHREGFTLADGAVRLAEGPVFPNQAFRYGGSAFGVQFHPEITLAMIHRWTVRAAARLSQPGAQQPADHINAHTLHGAKLRAWTFGFLKNWLRGGQAAEAHNGPGFLERAA